MKGELECSEIIFIKNICQENYTSNSGKDSWGHCPTKAGWKRRQDGVGAGMAVIDKRH